MRIIVFMASCAIIAACSPVQASPTNRAIIAPCCATTRQLNEMHLYLYVRSAAEWADWAGVDLRISSATCTEWMTVADGYRLFRPKPTVMFAVIPSFAKPKPVRVAIEAIKDNLVRARCAAVRFEKIVQKRI